MPERWSLAQFKEVHHIVLPSFSQEEHKNTAVIEGEEVMTLRPEEQGTQKLSENTSKIPSKMGSPLMDEDLVVLCQAPYQSIKQEEWAEMHEEQKEVTEKIGVKKAGQSVVGLGKVAWRKTQKESSMLSRGRHSGNRFRQCGMWTLWKWMLGQS